ncbi:DUF1275 domain-containing protein [Reichenbachiella agarivorans]|uniref:DUF1275 domain-containing protein n=1 Tax=Reichenbachiella agarivorans TaxID=2979464 RepID=A0ABY6CRX2_9BACT|nr:YoaK family protein [Reichenbachiella agarivorans]UXP32198.1 DUF1275 domain-containing protein [Reichenbachiella agarivorans]
MLRKFDTQRSLSDNIKLGTLTAMSAGMVNVMSVIVFFAYTSNVTGHYAVLAEELSKGNWYQAGVVAAWILLFFFGGFLANFIIINLNRFNVYLAHALPLAMEIVCLLIVGSYVQFFYMETLVETEILIGFMLLAMGIQNGLTASISGSTVKTTHLTGLTTDLGILFSMFTQREFRQKKHLRDKAKMQTTIMLAYLLGGFVAGYLYYEVSYNVFYIVCLFLFFIICYDYYQIRFSVKLNRA